MDKKEKYALYGFLSLMALGLLFISLSRYQFYQNFIDLRNAAHYDLKTASLASDKKRKGAVYSLQEKQEKGAAYSLDKAENQKIDVNNADLQLLISLPGIGRETALNIIEYRNQHGDFKRIENLINVKGIGIKKLEKLKDCVIIK